jgi:glycine/sarcosine/betaine reductase complex component A
MDLENQNRVKNLAEEHGAENVVVIFGAAEAESSVLAAETCTSGDPTYAGPLTGIALGLSVFHAVEPEFKEAVDADVYEEQVGMMEMVLNVDEIVSEMSRVRSEACKYL